MVRSRSVFGSASHCPAARSTTPPLVSTNLLPSSCMALVTSPACAAAATARTVSSRALTLSFMRAV